MARPNAVDIMRTILFSGAVLAGAAILSAQFQLKQQFSEGLKPGEIAVRSDLAWTDTGIDLRAGDLVKIVAEGQITFPGAGKNAALMVTPKGVSRGFRDLMMVYPVNDAPRGALVGRWGDSPAARAFLIGDKFEGRVPITGHLFLGLNQTAPAAADGNFKALITHNAAAETTESFELPDFTQALIDQIPRRVEDATGTPGDRTNFAIVGTEEQVKAAFATAGWSAVDKDKGSAVVSGILATLARRSYVTLPMSVLNLFGRGQDFGYAQGDPVMVVAQRHHFRLWKAPFDLNGLTVWAGAGTHDIGFDKDQRNGGLTHKIDPDVDLEREYIGESLKATGMVVKTAYLTPSDPITTAKTAHGEEFHSDGRTLIIFLRPPTPPTPQSPPVAEPQAAR